MNKLEKELAKYTLEQEAAILKKIENQYKQALKDVKEKISVLKAREDIINNPSIIYQMNYQKAVRDQIKAILDNMKTNNYTSVMDYLQKSYTDGFIGSVYDLHGQKIPLIMPIDQEQMVAAIINNTKLSEGLYKKLGEDVNELNKQIQNEVSRGISNNYSYDQIAKLIDIKGDIYKNKAYRIARTEGHRIQEEAKLNAMTKAKSKGADIVKQWDASLDKRTRPAHAKLDGQIRELDEEFEGGALQPGCFGIAAMDINCRCTITQRAKWALDEEELDELKKRAAYFNLDKSKDFEDFKKKYIEAVKELDVINTVEEAQTFDPDTYKKMQAEHTPHYNKANNTKYKYEKKYGDFSNWPKDAQDEWLALKKISDDEKKALEAYKALKVNGQNLKPNVQTPKKVTKAEKIKKLQTDIDELQKELNNISNKIPNETYSGIWINDVSLSDYESKKNSIAAKKTYFKQKIADPNTPDNKIVEFKKYLKDLDEFEQLGQAYLKEEKQLQGLKDVKQAKIKSLQDELDKLHPKKKKIDDPYSKERKDAAYWFTQDNGFKQAADKVLRKPTGDVWQTLTKKQQDALYEYTAGSGKFNRPLRGYDGSWWNFKGVGKVPLNNEGAGVMIKAMTDAIDKSSYDFDIWLQRGVDSDGAAAFLEIDPKLLNGTKEAMENAILNKTVTDEAFVSCGSAKGEGFSGSVILNVYAPKGTKMIYAEPFSKYGRGDGLKWDGKSGQSSFGYEFETIIQRGYDYKITKVDVDGSGWGKTWYIDIEVHPK